MPVTCQKNLFNTAIEMPSFNHTIMNLSEDQFGITKKLIVSKALIENSRKLIKELEVLIKQRESDSRRLKASGVCNNKRAAWQAAPEIKHG